MSVPSAFDIGRQVGTNFANVRKNAKDESVIENILSQAMNSGNPEAIQNSIGQILSQVSPERQGAAIQYLQGTYNNLQKKQDEREQFKREEQAGLQPGINPTSQAAIYKESQKNNRIQNANNVFNDSGANQPSAFQQANTQQPSAGQPQAPQTQDASLPPQNATGQAEQRKKQLLALTGHPDREVSERAKAELKEIENKEKLSNDEKKSFRKETAKLREDLANKAMDAQRGIQNKQELLSLIRNGNLDDPTYAALAEALPLNLGKRLLSDDTVTYKAGLVDEFKDLRNIFKGATRVKEIDILENKLADIYLTDSQKEAVLNSRINALKSDIILAEAAEELEDKPLGVLQFQRELQKIAKPKLDALFNQILDEQQAIIKNAENRKQIPLDYNDPEDKEIVQQIYLQAGKDWKKAEQLAKEKGYHW